MPTDQSAKCIHPKDDEISLVEQASFLGVSSSQINKVISVNTKRPRTEKRLGKEDFFLHTFWVTMTQNYIGYRRHLSLWKIPQIILGLKSQPLYVWLRYSCELMNVPLFSLPMDIMCAFTFLIENDLFSAAKQGICLMDVYSEKL